eukprot:NODE_3128_length_1042_cov_38.933535_g2874_i0.p1 GENE.NODE_3128_length_1042_cov_38.933535_g2874_i0~~NODE_3128_length_1042_cov_38.933535_g2874_i0.p1  ORF type:complete len:283 (-),score=38.70 NODE_3128_length_1042_cov_38.933535_g2874_i0:94-942(-)
MPGTKIILITGANKGIGKAAVASTLQQCPEAHVLLGSRDLARGEDAKKDLCAKHPEWASRISTLAIDVSSPDSVTNAAKEVEQRYGRTLYAVVNNAGIGLSDSDLEAVLQVNTFGVIRVCDAFVPLIQSGGRVVNVTSASGPNYVSSVGAESQRILINPEATRADIGAFAASARAEGETNAYGISKALANTFTMVLAREHPQLLINACTPGFIETDLTRSLAASRGASPASMGMKSPEEGTVAITFLLFGTPQGSGHYYGSDAQRSPLDRYRSPGSPAYTGP